MKERNLYKVALAGFALAGCVVLIFSCFSFDIGDKPSDYVWPHNDPVANWCGSIGAFFSYYLMYYIGPGVYVLLGVGIWGLGASLTGVKITQPTLRAIGLGLLVSALSSSVYFFQPVSGSGFPMGGGGILGISSANFLQGHLATLGTSIVVGSTWLVGAILLADTAVLAILRWIGLGICRFFGLAAPAWSAARERSRELGAIWHKLNERQQKRAQRAVSILRAPSAVREPISPPDESSDEQSGGEDASRGRSGILRRSGKKAKVAKKKADSGASVAGMSVAGGGRDAKSYVPKSYEDYELPPVSLLKSPEFGFTAIQEKMVERKASALESLLSEFGVHAHVVNAEAGPAITMYELELAPGIKVSQISNLANDMARALSAGSVRVVAPLAGRHTIGIEVPNTQREVVRIKDLIQRGGSRPDRMHIPLFLGKSSSGEVLTADLAAMPHLLIAGTTGSGKSVCINSIIMSILMTRRPDEVKMILIDPKMVEMAIFDMIPHLMCPPVTDIKRSEQILSWATTKMDERYELLAEAQVRNIASYNKLGAEEIVSRFKPSTPEEEAKIPKRLPHLVIVIDELADLMMTAGKEIEAYIVRLAQKSRAVGIHLVVATQRPQATVVTGLIKSNMPCRIGFRVASRMDSRIILDQNGAETLLGQGDMLFLKPGTSDLMRAQGGFVDDKEVRVVVKFLKEVAQPQFHPELMQLNRIDTSAMTKDDLFDEAVRIVLETKRGSVSLLQRRLSIGYARASRIIELMAASGFLGEYKGSQAREVTMTVDEYEAAKKEMMTETVAGMEDLTEGDEEEYEDAIEEVEDEDVEEDEYEDEEEEDDEDEGEDEDEDDEDED